MLTWRLKEKELVGIIDGFRKTQLEQSQTLDHVFERVAPRIFESTSPNAADAIRFVQIAARLDVSLPPSTPLKFLCVDGNWRQRSDGLVVLSDIDLEYLLPEAWLCRHLISPEYEKGMQGSDALIWRKWAVQPQKGGLSSFARPVPVNSNVWNLDPTLFRARGSSVPLARWRSTKYECTDFNWDRAILDHWNRLESSDGATIWLDIARAVISAWSAEWDELTLYQVHQQKSSRSRIDDKNTPAAWLHELRSRACVPDTYGTARIPAELLRRTPETSALLYIEPFVHESWDTAELQTGLDRLGVRSQATEVTI
ncbi:MAG: hypothetical protein M1541_14495 [Acidobacteria bacterium]|nr:hypothetical protein [Acidobacteriota bacterium]